MFDWWWAYLALGAAVGFIAGLLGVGGGALIAAVLAFVFAAKQFAPAAVVHLALGTAMATIMFTSVSSVFAHHRHGAVDWPAVRRLSAGIALGAASGALLAGRLDLRPLTLVFTVLIYLLAAQMLFAAKPRPGAAAQTAAGATAAAAVIGVIASLTATGGAAMVVGYLVKRGMAIHRAIGTAAAIGWPLSVAGTAGYVAAGWGRDGLPPHAAGYVYLPALAVIVVSSMLFAPLGARLAHRSPAALLKKLFALLLFALATKMLASFF
jgi:uncharacterized membrane protein YfcA